MRSRSTVAIFAETCSARTRRPPRSPRRPPRRKHASRLSERQTAPATALEVTGGWRCGSRRRGIGEILFSGFAMSGDCGGERNLGGNRDNREAGLRILFTRQCSLAAHLRHFWAKLGRAWSGPALII
jgi:hypothetical protein